MVDKTLEEIKALLEKQNIEPDVIERRYKAGIKNLFHLYSNKVDSLLIFDNSKPESELIAEKEIENEILKRI